MTKPLQHTPTPSTLNKEDWPPNYREVYRWRQERLLQMRLRPELMRGALKYYEAHPVDFINHWVDTFDPRNVAKGKLSRMPLVMFEKQAEFIEFLMQMIEGEQDGLVEKCRDMGATWVCCAFSVWLWRFRAGTSVGWGSRKQDLVDRIGVVDSIFEKMRIIIMRLPKEFWPDGFKPNDHLTFMKIINPDNGSVISGEAGDNIGRGGRNLIYFKDESAHYERPELIEAALGDNTRVQIDISSVNGTGNVFHRKRQSGVLWKGRIEERNRTQVFVMDWRDHPEKTESWYQERKAKAQDSGLMHVFAQEIDRDYSSSLEGVLIPNIWVEAAVDLHLRRELDEATGMRYAGLDVADEGRDRNALATRISYQLSSLKSWAQGDVGETARATVTEIRSLGFPGVRLQYDSIGVGAGVKSETNRLRRDRKLPEGLRVSPWAGSNSVLHPERNIIEGDRQSPKNKDFFKNLKAQAWWNLRVRFERTYKFVEKGIEAPHSELICLPSDLSEIYQLKQELSQVTISTDSSGKVLINKTPEGTASPNLADSVVMAFFPIDNHGRVGQMGTQQ